MAAAHLWRYFPRFHVAQLDKIILAMENDVRTKLFPGWFWLNDRILFRPDSRGMVARLGTLPDSGGKIRGFMVVNSVSVAVQDFGIPFQNRRILFERFWKAGNGRSHLLFLENRLSFSDATPLRDPHGKASGQSTDLFNLWDSQMSLFGNDRECYPEVAWCTVCSA